MSNLPTYIDVGITRVPVPDSAGTRAIHWTHTLKNLGVVPSDYGDYASLAQVIQAIIDDTKQEVIQHIERKLMEM